MVKRAKRDNVKTLQFTPTLFWVDEGPLNPPPGFDFSCKSSNLSSYYCYNRFNATSVKYWCYDRDQCHSPDQWEIDRFRDALAACMKVAVASGFNLAVNMHVDDATNGGLGGWRNTLDFSPLDKYGGRSYEEVVLNPIADAIKAAAGANTKVDLIMQGEMGATIFYHSKDWLAVSQEIKSRIGSGSSLSSSNIRTGVGINNAKVSGSILIPIVDHREFLAEFPAAFAQVKSDFDLPAIHSLFDGIDFVGISAYIPLPDPFNFTICDLEGLLEGLDEEMGFYGLSIGDLTSKGKSIHYIEFGVGGGTSANGDTKATTAEEAAFTPFFVRDYDRRFYNATSQYLLQGGCAYKNTVGAVHLWNLPSWDVQGIYPISTTSEGSYRDPAIVDLINKHNAIAFGTSG
ncbi:hypothetical protein N2152v2_000552 [Parachlorella kessleri]